MSEQLNLWDRRSLNPVGRVKEAMRMALKGSPRSREQVVEEINRLAKVEGIRTNGRAGGATPEMLDKWVAASEEHIVPWKLLPIFCLVTGSLEPLRALVAPLGAEVVAEQDVVLLKWARAEVQTRKLRKVKRRLEEEIEI